MRCVYVLWISSSNTISVRGMAIILGAGNTDCPAGIWGGKELLFMYYDVKGINTCLSQMLIMKNGAFQKV